jgi:hypothetical protein
MKFSLTFALLAAIVALANASEQQCEQKYGPAPHGGEGEGQGMGQGGMGQGGPGMGQGGPGMGQSGGNGYNIRDLGYDPRCAQYGYYRNLKQRDFTIVSTQELVADHGATCSDAQYDIYLVIQGAHFVGLGTPIGEENAACPNLVMHSKSEKGSPMEKVVMLAGDDEIALVQAEEMLHLGSRNLAEIVSAFDNVEAGKNGEKFYDAVTNNCVSLLRNMADPLNISIDDRMIKFVSNRLLQSTADHVFESIRSSPALNKLLEGGQRFLKGVSKEDMLAKLIKLYV